MDANLRGLGNLPDLFFYCSSQFPWEACIDSNFRKKNTALKVIAMQLWHLLALVKMHWMNGKNPCWPKKIPYSFI